jgi:DNA ligase-associated metallophosphoesterase
LPLDSGSAKEQDMNDAYSFALNGTHALALPSGALFLPGENLLCVSDLHLAKSERWARRRGVMLPPYETRATLDRLAQDLATTKPACVVALGDSFDDLAASEALEIKDRATLARLQEGRRWVWIERQPRRRPHAMGGEGCAEFPVAGRLTFRHIADRTAPGEVSGHYHPSTACPAGRARPCFLLDARRLILPPRHLHRRPRRREPVLRTSSPTARSRSYWPPRHRRPPAPPAGAS